MATRKVEENTAALGADDATTDDPADNVGGPVAATDPAPNADANDALVYSLSGADASKFRVRQDDATTTEVNEGGQIEVAAGTELDYETKSTYTVTVTVEDSFGLTASIPVTIMVTDVDEKPEIDGGGEADYPENGDGTGSDVHGDGPGGCGDPVVAERTDAGDFTIENGVLRFKESPDFETPMGGGDAEGTPFGNTYTVVVQATDETRMTAMKTVTVKVTNVDEAGMVTLSARRPQSATAFTATVTDIDGAVSNAKWQWAQSASRNGSYTDIDGAVSPTYAPKDADIGSYLRATVTYEDPEGEDKTATARSEFSVQAVRGSNTAPKFADDQDPVMEGDQADATREVAENTAAGKTVGAPVQATDADGDDLTYTLEGTDAASFDIDWATGQILTKAALDFETTPSYSVTVRATTRRACLRQRQRRGQQRHGDGDHHRDRRERSAGGDRRGRGVLQRGHRRYSDRVGHLHGHGPGCGGSDAHLVGGRGRWREVHRRGRRPQVQGEAQLRESDRRHGDNVYEVTVQASDGRLTGTRIVKVTVVNANEDGTVTLNRTTPRVGIPVTASLTDPDGGVSRLTWQWSNADGDIDGATAATYTPVGGDVGDTLTATASYLDAATARTPPRVDGHAGLGQRRGRGHQGQQGAGVRRRGPRHARRPEFHGDAEGGGEHGGARR